MGSKRGKEHAKRALPLYVTPRMEGDPNGNQAEGEGGKEGRKQADLNADFIETQEAGETRACCFMIIVAKKI